MEKDDVETIIEALKEILHQDTYKYDAEELLLKEIELLDDLSDDEKISILNLVKECFEPDCNVDDVATQIVNSLLKSNKFSVKYFEMRLRSQIGNLENSLK